MKERFNKIIHSRLFIIVLMGILMCTTMLVGTYAWLTWSSTDNTKLVMSIGRLADVVFSSGNDINGGLTPVFDYKDGLSTNFTINNRESVISYVVNFNITTIDSNLISKDVKWAIEKNGKLVNEGDLSKVSNGVSIDIYNGVVLTEQNSYTFYLYIDGNVENNPNMINKTITGNIMVEASEFDSFNLSNYITNLYSNNMPELITHSKINNTSDTYYYSYQDGTKTWGLMNDGLKVDNTLDATTTGLATTVTSTEALKGTEGNIRYFGPSDKVNNYIYFNCSDYSNQSDSTCEKWRIIGIVDGKVKLIRDKSIGDYSWDNKNRITGAESEYGRNDWSDARLMRLLNPGYENYVDKDNSGNDLIANNSLYWNSGSGTCYAGKHNETKTCDFTTTGLKNDITRNMISESSWYLGGYSTAEGVYPNDIYKYERTNKVGTTIYSGNPYTINANIGLINASDYGYGTNLTKCNRYLDAYNDSGNSYACRSNNWLILKEQSYWSITVRSSSLANAWLLKDGHVNAAFGVYDVYGVRPVLYLEENLTINKGNGTSDSPYQIYIPKQESTTTLIEFIKNQYTSNIPEQITQANSNDRYYYSYQDDTETWGLMNDGLKVDTSLDATTTGLATTVTNINALTGTEGNIRYFGPSDKVNNYIYFNCSDYSNQSDSTCEKWRIIGIVDGKVKIIRNESIGSYSWDNKNTITGALTDNGSNNWSDARLMRLLNPGYENYVDKDNSGNDLIANNSLYWNSGSGTCYSGQYNGTKTCDFTSTGLKNDETREMISESTWYLGGYHSHLYPNDIYNNERTNKVGTTIYNGNTYTINANIGLMYPSDYGYGTNLTKCSQKLYNYHNSADSYACRTNNWLFNSSYQWLITPLGSHSDYTWEVNSESAVYYTVPAYYSMTVRPVLYLNSELVMESGHQGTSTDPYRISVS